MRNLESTLGLQLFARAGRGVQLTIAGEDFTMRAAAVLAALDDAVASVDAIAGLQGGTLAFGLFATPEAYAIDLLASAFTLRYPGVAIRLVGRNSSVSADRVRSGELEAALVTLPIDDAGLGVQPFARDEVVYVSAEPAHTAAAVTIEDLVRRPLVIFDAESGDRDPLRRQLQQRAQESGLRIVAKIETETMVMALRLVADGAGDTLVPRAHTRTAYFPAGLSTVPLSPVAYETFAIVTRSGSRPSPATRAFVDMVIAHMRSAELGLETVSEPPAEDTDAIRA